MKVITAEQAVAQFIKHSQLAHDGKRILVTRNGEAWVMLTPPTRIQAAKLEGGVAWPDFAGQLAPFYPQATEGPTAGNTSLSPR